MAERLHITPIGDDGMYILDTASWRVFRPVMDKEKKACPIAMIQVTGSNRASHFGISK